MSSELQAALQEHLGSGYTVERELGGGGMSLVFVVQDHRLARLVAVKLLLPSLAATVSVDRFQREIMLAARLQHPHIVPVLSAGELNHLPYFVMPFIQGESLRTRVMRGPLSVRETVGIMKDVAKALAYAHGHGVVHRDIKPDNVLLSAGTAMVTDFGVAKAILSARDPSAAASRSKTVTGIGFTAGTPAYMAPEQAAADPNIDAKADLYALGIMAYEMLAGAPPFHGRTPQSLLKAQLSETPPALPSRRYDVPAALDNLISQCLEKEPVRRPKSASEIARALESPEYVSGAFASPPRGSRRRSRRVIGLAVALTALTALVFFRWNAGKKAEPAFVATPVVAPAGNLGRSLAVLPLGSSSSRDAGIAAGATAELTNAVSRIPGLRVASQTAVAGTRGTDRLTTLGTLLGVTMVIEGSVQTSGKNVRLSLRLVKVSNDSTVWVDRFDGTTDDVFAIQDAAARAVVVALSTRLR